MSRRELVLVALCACTTPRATSVAEPVVDHEDMVAVPAGSFVQGHDDALRRDEAPAHLVHVSAFAIDRTLVTRAAFTRFADQTGYVTSAERIGYGVGAREGMEDWAWERMPRASFRHPFLGEPSDDERGFLHPDAPAVMISFTDAEAFCRWRHARLPTEAEWEYAMRAGSEGTRYPWGVDAERDGKLALNFWQGESHRKNDRTDGFVYVSPVRAFPPNAWGIHDPVGNVWQWTADFYASDAYARAGREIADPKGPSEGKTRVLRGGSWWCGACTCEGNGLNYRGKADPGAPFDNNGFRCAR